MRLTYRFTVGAPVNVTWRVITDVESVSGCLPGAAPITADGDDLEGQFKIKFGLMSLVYKGSGQVTVRDVNDHTVTVEARGSDVRDSGTADAAVTTRLDEAGNGTDVTLTVAATLTGRPAQLGPDVITEAVDWQIDQFAACLSRKLTESSDLVHPVQRTTSPEHSSASGRTAPSDEWARAGTRTVPDAVSRARNVTPVLVRRYGIPVLGGLAALFATLTLIKRRRRGR